MINENAIKAVFERSLKLKPDEKCLIVTDVIKEPLAEAFFDHVGSITEFSNMVVIEPTHEHGAEPPSEVAKMMLEYDVQLLITAKSLTHTAARRAATEKGARIATMPDINREIANRCLDIDYEDLRKRSMDAGERLKRSSNIRVTTEQGTDIYMKVGAGRFFGAEGGIYEKPGDYGNLPEGEIAFAPEASEGVFIVDASICGIGLLSSPLTFKVKDNTVYDITGAKADELKTRLDKVGSKAYHIAELGIGLNPKATITGNILEDEKVIGTVHIALGNNCSFGGSNDVPLHIDGVITSPDVYLDGNLFMRSGKFV